MRLRKEEEPDMLEIRWHGRGGQGAKTAAQLLGEAAAAAGRYIQAFPEYGPERSGAPILAFNRISDRPIRVHANVASPKVVIVLDPTLLGKTNIVEDLPPDGILIVNTSKSPQAIRKMLGLSIGKVFTIDANRISLETLGRVMPNTPLMGALIRATGVVEYSQFLEKTRSQLEYKFKSKPKVVEGNMEAIARAYREVQEG